MNKRERFVRKLQQTKMGTFLVSLPKEWVNQNNLRSSADVGLIWEKDGSLVIPAQIDKKGHAKCAIVHVSHEDNLKSIFRIFTSTYLVGFDKIRIIAKEGILDEKQRDSIRRIVGDRLIGPEVTNDSRSELAYRIVVDFKSLPLEDAMKQACEIVTTMFESSLELLKEVGTEANTVKERAEWIANRDNQVDRYYRYVIRLLKAAVDDVAVRDALKLPTGRHCLGYRLIIKSIERIGDHWAKVCHVIRESLEKKVPIEILQQIDQKSQASMKAFRRAMRCLFEEDFEGANEVVDEAESIVKWERAFAEKIFELHEMTARELSGLRTIAESVKRSAEYSSDIADIVLNLTVNKKIDIDYF